MQAHRIRRYWLASCILLLFFAAGCFQPAGANLEATSVAQSMPTFTPIPSETPVPTETPESTPTETPTESSIVTLEGILPIATDTLDPLALLTGTEVAALPQQGEGDALVQTATAIALQTQGLAPQQPVGTATETLDPFYVTATFIVGNATNAAAAPMTQTAQAILGVTATPQPSATTLGAPAATAIPTGSCVHTVVAGQNLFRISLQYNTTIDALASANGIVNPAMIIAGQQLTIPGCGTSSQTTPGTTTGSGTVYVVQQGDTLFEISLQYGVTVNALATRNNISNINLILIGQQIVIP